MSGPVSNSLAQLEDALFETGLDKDLIFNCIAGQLAAIDRERHGPQLNKELRQRLWDHLAILRPAWRFDAAYEDLWEALKHNEKLEAAHNAMIQQQLEVLQRDYGGRWRDAPVDLVEDYARQWHRLFLRRRAQR